LGSGSYYQVDAVKTNLVHNRILQRQKMGTGSTMKRCCTCKQFKALSEFYTDNTQTDKKYRACKQCTNIRCKRYALSKRDDPATIQRNRRNWIKAEYNITLEEYENILERQNLACLICGRELGHFKRHTHLDHCHTTGKIRGFLCRGCNQGLGNFNENIELLQKAQQYLEKHK